MGQPEDGARPVYFLTGAARVVAARSDNRRETRRRQRLAALARSVYQRQKVLAILVAVAGAVLLVLVSRAATLLGEGTDLYGRWFGLRQLLLAGQNPYGPEITRALAAQSSFLSPASDPGAAPTALETAFGFLYPLPGLLVLTPLALLPYPIALTLWLLAIVLMLPLAAGLVVDAVAPSSGAAWPASAGGAGLARRLAVPLGLVFLPTLASLLHAQLAPAVAFFVALAVWFSWRRGVPRPAHDFLAGAALVAGVALKPHLLAVLSPLWLGFHSWQLQQRSRQGRSRRFLVGAGATAAALAGMAWLLLPSWPTDFLQAARSYAALAGADYPSVTRAVLPGGSAVLRLAGALLPGRLAWSIAGLLSLALLAWAAAGWQVQPLRAAAPQGGSGDALAGARRRRPGDADADANRWRSGSAIADAERRGLSRSLIASALVLPPAWEANAVLLLIPLAIRLGDLSNRPALAASFVIASGVLTVLDLPLYMTQPWHNGPLLILCYVLLLAGSDWFGRSPHPRRAEESVARSPILVDSPEDVLSGA
ncbi:MAG: glycosyltransferase 87 family protein [Chloroflexota bacterium]|nr:glycosyltransferase 87 family protein [Chloroflexota bacterium]